MFNTLVIFPFSFIVVIAFVTSPGKIQKNSTFLHGLNMNSLYFLLLIVGDYNPPPTEKLS